jgi:hypothetical protein
MKRQRSWLYRSGLTRAACCAEPGVKQAATIINIATALTQNDRNENVLIVFGMIDPHELVRFSSEESM